VTSPFDEAPGFEAPSEAGRPVQRMLRALFFGPTRRLAHQFARYLIVGGLAFVVDFCSLYLLTEFAGIYYLISAGIAFLLGLITNYALSLLWVFDRRAFKNPAIEFVAFAVIGVIGLALNEAIIWFVREKIQFHYMFAKAISGGIVLVWNFGARKALLFR